MRFNRLLVRRSPLTLGAIAIAAVSVTGAGAATVERFASTGYTGTEGAVAYNNTSANGSALEGTVGSKDTTTKIPFGVAGEYNASTTVFGLGIGGYSTSGVGAAGYATGKYSGVYGIYAGKGSGSATVGNAGVEGHTEYGSASSSGLLGVADTSATGAAGVVGLDNGGGNAGVGVYGSSISGYGMIGALTETTSTHRPALLALSSTSTTGFAQLGLEDGQAVLGQGPSAPGTPVPIIQSNGYNTASPLYAGLAVNSAGNVQNLAFVVQASSQNRSGTVSTSGGASDVQVQGDLYLTGKVYTGCTTFPATSTSTCGSSVGQTASVRSRSGAAITAFSSAHANPTVEDEGEAKLSSGGAHITLDAAFASTIATDRPYLVFVTPMGRSGQLFVTNRNLTGFDVRENGGSSAVTFDYRIVARPFAAAATDRMALARASAVHVSSVSANYLPARPSRSITRMHTETAPTLPVKL